jgi:hypothetical protein
LSVALSPSWIVEKSIVPATSLAVTLTPAIDSRAATVDALTGPAPKVAASIVIDCCAPPLTATRMFLPTKDDRSN